MSRMTDAEWKALGERVDAILYNKDEDRMHVEDRQLFLAAHRELVALRKVMEAAEGILPTAGARSPTQKLVLANLRAALNAAKGE